MSRVGDQIQPDLKHTIIGDVMNKKFIIEIKDVDLELENMKPEKLISWAIEDIFHCSSDFVTVKELKPLTNR